MGIPGIYKELGPGTRVSLAKLSVEHLETTSRRFRLAIDISIWQFQIRSALGGQNPALRTLYYRLLRLLGLGIQPLFVFDGPYRPTFKRNARTAPNAACVDNFLTKQLLKRFGFPFHNAPGEAEAECALLQKEGIVDAVLSEDVDTMMFGCTMSLRNWTAESVRSGKTPTHVNMYTAQTSEKNFGLDCQGMILVALMSGGDYDTEGLSNCGPKIACEAARAGFGQGLCQLAKDDAEGWREWRERLQRELHTNENGFFKQKHKTINIPETFPDQTVLGYYKRPAISSPKDVTRLRHSLKWETDIDISGLRVFVSDAFNWTYRIGASHFIRTFAPVLLVHKLLEKSTKDEVVGDNLHAKATSEAQYVTAIHGRRAHWNTDGSPELRISYLPNDVVGLDLSTEEGIDQSDEVLESLEPDKNESDGEEQNRLTSPSKRRGPATYNPTQPEKIWILETFLKLGTPLLVETWEENMRDPRMFATRKAREKAARSKVIQDPPIGVMDQFVKITKPFQLGRDFDGAIKKTLSKARPSSLVAPKSALAASDMAMKALKENRNPIEGLKKKKPAMTEHSNKSINKAPIERKAATTPSPNNRIANPWILSKRPSDTSGFISPTRYSALGVYAPGHPEKLESRLGRPSNPPKPDVAIKYLTTLTSVMSHQKHTRSNSTSSDSSSELARSLDNITIRSARRPEKKKLSPKKKQVNDLSVEECLRTPTKPRSEKDVICLDESVADEAALEPSIGPNPNIKLDFTKSNILGREASPPFPASDDSSLPSLSALFPPATEYLEVAAGDRIATAPGQLGPLSHISTHDRGERTFISLRESLEGAWKRIEPWQASEIKDVYTDVEIVDMTLSGKKPFNV